MRMLEGYERFLGSMTINVGVCGVATGWRDDEIEEAVRVAVRCVEARHPYLGCRIDESGRLVRRGGDPFVVFERWNSIEISTGDRLRRELRSFATAERASSETTFSSHFIWDSTGPSMIGMLQYCHACADGKAGIEATAFFLACMHRGTLPEDVESYPLRNPLPCLDWLTIMALPDKDNELPETFVPPPVDVGGPMRVEFSSLSTEDSRTLRRNARAAGVGVQSCFTAAAAAAFAHVNGHCDGPPLVMLALKQLRDLAINATPKIEDDEFVVGAATIYHHFQVAKDVTIWDLAVHAHANLMKGIDNKDHLRFFKRMASRIAEPISTCVASSFGPTSLAENYTGDRGTFAVNDLYATVGLTRQDFSQQLYWHAYSAAGKFRFMLGYNEPPVSEATAKRMVACADKCIQFMAHNPMNSAESPTCSVSTSSSPVLSQREAVPKLPVAQAMPEWNLGELLRTG